MRWFFFFKVLRVIYQMRPSWFLYLYLFRNENRMKKTFAFCKRGGANLFLFYGGWCTGALRQIYCKIDEVSLSRVSQDQSGSQSYWELKHSNGKPAETWENKIQRKTEMNRIKDLRQPRSWVTPVSLQVDAKAYAGSGGCLTWSR